MSCMLPTVPWCDLPISPLIKIVFHKCSHEWSSAHLSFLSDQVDFFSDYWLQWSPCLAPTQESVSLVHILDWYFLVLRFHPVFWPRANKLWWWQPEIYPPLHSNIASWVASLSANHLPTFILSCQSSSFWIPAPALVQPFSWHTWEEHAGQN